VRKDSGRQGSGSTTPTWEVLEGFVRQKAQELIQEILEQEVTELLGRAKSERKTAGRGGGLPERIREPEAPGDESRDDHRASAPVRGLEERFESRMLPLFARRTREVGALLPELYLHGLAEGDSNWPCEGCWARRRRCRRRRCVGFARAGRRTSRPGVGARGRTARWCTRGRTGSREGRA